MSVNPIAIRQGLKRKFPGISLRDAIFAERAERSFYEFVKQAWHTVEKDEFTDGMHIKEICKHLQAVTEGKIRNLAIAIPPRHSKTSLVSIFWPAWEWTHSPNMRYLSVSYAKNLTTRDSQKCRALLDSNWYKARWGSRWDWAPDQNSKTRFNNNKGGTRIATAFGSAVGEGGDRIIIDDPLSGVQASSKVERDNCIDNWNTSFGMRTNDPKKSVRILIMQRLHERDLFGYLQDTEPNNWVFLILPMEFVPEKKCITPIGGDWRTEAGEPLWPNRYGSTEEEIQEYIKELKRKLPPYDYAAQAQQNPVPPHGGIFLKTWWKYFTTLPKDDIMQYITSWDTAVKAKESSDYTVGILAAFSPKYKKYYILDVYRERVEYVEQEKAILKMYEQCPWAIAHIIEDKANGPAIVSRLQKIMPGVIPRDPGNIDKESRWRAISPRVAAGDVFLLEEAPWLAAWISELSTVPKAQNDDIADALEQLINWNETRGMLPSERRILIGRPTDDILKSELWFGKDQRKGFKPLF